MDWLTFPGPSLTPDGTSLHKGSKVSAQSEFKNTDSLPLSVYLVSVQVAPP